jgi:hypothetical protein
MSKAYSKGYEQGYKDGCAGKSKHVNPKALWEGLKNALNPFGSVDQFVKGYEEGYRIGSRDRVRGRCK